MSDIETGGSAFPANHFDMVEGEHGITLRDYFAAKAMQGLLAHPSCRPVGKNHEQVTNFVVDESYAMADAMLEARK